MLAIERALSFTKVVKPRRCVAWDRLRAIVPHGTGVDSIDLDAATLRAARDHLSIQPASRVMTASQSRISAHTASRLRARCMLRGRRRSIAPDRPRERCEQ